MSMIKFEDEADAKIFLSDLKLHFTKYYKGLATFNGEKDGYLIEAVRGNMTYEDAYYISFSAEEDAESFLDDRIVIKKDGITVYEKTDEY